MLSLLWFILLGSTQFKELTISTALIYLIRINTIQRTNHKHYLLRTICKLTKNGILTQKPPIISQMTWTIFMFNMKGMIYKIMFRWLMVQVWKLYKVALLLYHLPLNHLFLIKFCLFLILKKIVICLAFLFRQ